MSSTGRNPGLEREVQGHLNLPGTANGLIHLPEAKGRVVERLTLRGEIVVVLVLRNIIDRNVETGGIGDVENVQSVFQRNPLRDFQVLDQRYVGTLLPDLTKDVALARGKVSLKGVAGSNCPTQGAGLKQGQSETRRLKRRRCARTGGAGHRIVGGATGGKWGAVLILPEYPFTPALLNERNESLPYPFNYGNYSFRLDRFE